MRNIDSILLALEEEITEQIPKPTPSNGPVKDPLAGAVLDAHVLLKLRFISIPSHMIHPVTPQGRRRGRFEITIEDALFALIWTALRIKRHWKRAVYPEYLFVRLRDLVNAIGMKEKTVRKALRALESRGDIGMRRLRYSIAIGLGPDKPPRPTESYKGPHPLYVGDEYALKPQNGPMPAEAEGLNPP